MPCDYKKYPENWKSEIVPAVLERAGNCCEECGLRNHSKVYSVTFSIKDDFGRYVLRAIWFSNINDALRECREDKHRMKEVKVILTISHTDHDEENKDVKLDRLKALCQACHLRYDAKEKYRRSLEKWKQPSLKL